MLFILKKWIGGLLMPLPLSLILLSIGLCLLFFTQRQKLAKSLTLISFIILLSFSLLPTSRYLANHLERQYPPLLEAEQSLDYILILGSSGIHDPKLPVTGQLSVTALARFSEALRLYYANPNAQLVLSGAAFGDTQSHAQLLETLALALRIPKQSIIRLDETKDTKQEAFLMSQIIRGKRAALVTSATHMPRAIYEFSVLNQSVIPAPAMYLSKENQQALPSYTYIPSAYQLYKSQLSVHEYLGILQSKIVKLLTEA